MVTPPAVTFHHGDLILAACRLSGARSPRSQFVPLASSVRRLKWPRHLRCC